MNEKLIDTIFRISRVLRQEMSISSKIARLSLLQLEILIYLKNKNLSKTNDLAKYFHISNPTVSSHLDTMHKIGLIMRKTDSNDRRLIHILLTKKGHLLLEEGLRQKNKRMNILLTYISDKDKQQLLQILTNLVNTIEK